MSQATSTLPDRPSWPRSLPFYYGWVNVVVAALAMTATLPGRTHGLGLVTEPLLADLALDRAWFARINLVGSLIGALFSIPAGWLIDRWGVRAALTGIAMALGTSVVTMSQVEHAATLLIMLILVRGFGQSALSVASMAAISKWFSRRLGLAMGLFAALLTFGFIASVLAMGAAVERFGWREAWLDLGLFVLVMAPIFWLLARSTPEECGLTPDAAIAAQPVAAEEASFTLRQALATPVFWVVALGTSAFNLVWSGVTLFNESMLVERGLEQQFAVEIMAILTGTGLLANMLGGAFATRARVVKLLGLGLMLLTAALVLFPSIDSRAGAQLYAAAIGLSGGLVTVVFFAAWGHLFGRAEIGRIQGMAQFVTVLASAAGPVLMAEGRARTGSYSPTFYLLAVMTALLALAAFFAPLPGDGSKIGR